jgi:hypothetical protein
MAGCAWDDPFPKQLALGAKLNGLVRAPSNYIFVIDDIGGKGCVSKS